VVSRQDEVCFGIIQRSMLPNRGKAISYLWTGPGLAAWGLVQSNTSIGLDWTEPYPNWGRPDH